MKYVSIIVTHYGNSSHLNDASRYEQDSNGSTYTVMSYAEGMRQLRELEKLLNKAANLDINQFNPYISHKSLNGYIRE